MRPQILLVEDSIPLARLIHHTLERMDMDVQHAKNGLEALTLLDENKPDVVLLDLKLPAVSGWEVMAYGRQKYPDLQVIIVTAQNKTNDHPQLKDVYKYIVKPVLPTEIMKLVEEALGDRV